jgi:hypothetical protein
MQHPLDLLQNLSNHASSPVLSSLIDGGTNGGMAGNDVRVTFESSSNQANVTGLGRASSMVHPWPLWLVSSLLIVDL